MKSISYKVKRIFHALDHDELIHMGGKLWISATWFEEVDLCSLPVLFKPQAGQNRLSGTTLKIKKKKNWKTAQLGPVTKSLDNLQLALVLAVTTNRKLQRSKK